jgi:hypothetical protein
MGCDAMQCNAMQGPLVIWIWRPRFTPGSHDDLGLEDAGFDLLVREHDAAVAVDLVADVDVLAEDGHVLDARPLADGGVPADDAAGDAGVLLDARGAHDGAAGQAHPGLHHAAWPDRDVGPDEAAVPDDRGLVHQHVAQDVRARREPGGRLLPQRVQVQAQARDVVPRLPDVHPETRENHGEEGPVRRDAREHLLLDGRRLQLDAAEHGRVEQVDAGVDLVAHERLGLLHEPLHLAGALLHDHHAVLGRLVDLGHHDRGLAAVGPVELNELGERVLADHVAVEHEERVAGSVGELVAGQGQRACGPEGLRLLRAGDLDAKLALEVLEKVEHDLRGFYRKHGKSDGSERPTKVHVRLLLACLLMETDRQRRGL